MISPGFAHHEVIPDLSAAAKKNGGFPYGIFKEYKK
jgi:hypothetical protein